MRSKFMKRVRILVYGFICCTILACVGLYLIGGILVAPKPTFVGQPPADLPIEVVQISKRGDGPIHGWFLEAKPHRAGVLLLHGVKSNRREMLERARFLLLAGYSVLLIDMQAHGETAGEYVTFGFLESDDVHYALGYLRTRVAGRPVAVIGSSMGGAAALLGKQPVRADAVILEAVFSTLEQAIENRIAIRLGNVGRILSPLLYLQLEPRLGIPLESVAPVNAVSKLHSPVLIISGTDDRHALPVEAQAIYDNANQPKSLWFVNGAKHQDLHRYDKQEYQRRVLGFFSENLN